MNESRYSGDRSTEEDKDFFDKYSPSGESEWSRGSVTPFDDEIVLSERHYHVESLEQRRNNAGKGPANYQRSDERIHDDASNALYQCADLDASDIEVHVESGIISLKGTVEDRISKKVAEMAVERLPGVIDVENNLVIENPRKRGLMHHSPVP